jgi:hypothetical protein
MELSGNRSGVLAYEDERYASNAPRRSVAID